MRFLFLFWMGLFCSFHAHSQEHPVLPKHHVEDFRQFQTSTENARRMSADLVVSDDDLGDYEFVEKTLSSNPEHLQLIGLEAMGEKVYALFSYTSAFGFGDQQLAAVDGQLGYALAAFDLEGNCTSLKSLFTNDLALHQIRKAFYLEKWEDDQLVIGVNLDESPLDFFVNDHDEAVTGNLFLFLSDQLEVIDHKLINYPLPKSIRILKSNGGDFFYHDFASFFKETNVSGVLSIEALFSFSYIFDVEFIDGKIAILTDNVIQSGSLEMDDGYGFPIIHLIEEDLSDATSIRMEDFPVRDASLRTDLVVSDGLLTVFASAEDVNTLVGVVDFDHATIVEEAGLDQKVFLGAGIYENELWFKLDDAVYKYSNGIELVESNVTEGPLSFYDQVILDFPQNNFTHLKVDRIWPKTKTTIIDKHFDGGYLYILDHAAFANGERLILAEGIGQADFLGQSFSMPAQLSSLIIHLDKEGNYLSHQQFDDFEFSINVFGEFFVQTPDREHVYLSKKTDDFVIYEVFPDELEKVFNAPKENKVAFMVSNKGKVAFDHDRDRSDNTVSISVHENFSDEAPLEFNYVTGGGQFGGYNSCLIFDNEEQLYLTYELNADDPISLSDKNGEITQISGKTSYKAPVLIKYDEDLNYLWHKYYGQDEDERSGGWISSLAVDRLGDLYVDMWTYGATQFEDGLQPVMGVYGKAILKYKQDGELVWRHSIMESHFAFNYYGLQVDDSLNVFTSYSAQLANKSVFEDDYTIGSKGDWGFSSGKIFSFVGFDKEGGRIFTKSIETQNDAYPLVHLGENGLLELFGNTRGFSFDREEINYTQTNAINRYVYQHSKYKAPERPLFSETEQRHGVYPNPVNEGYFMIHSEGKAGTYRLVDALGRTLSKGVLDTTQDTKVSVNGVAAGLYSVVLSDGTSYQLIVQ
ncbi:T9SS type A sorting domain-containing protein [Persicobacter psychrovividus]|uniref:Secretion system C-terminal sorting domain-containing protein n=1 Tax=Persicobacter psychrovividus TaxID=387638 RepID=A0ABN6LFU9_9BACT|nr:hypothetical protein PEPS_28780 [Persicobacter psychrovividus]